MSALGASGWAAGLLLVVAGIWLLLQTLVGGLPSRVLNLGGSNNTLQLPGPIPNKDSLAAGGHPIGGAKGPGY